MDKNQVIQNLLSGLDNRQGLVDKLRNKLQQMPEQDDQPVNLRPLMSWADTLTGAQTASGYELPKSKSEELKMKLQQQIDKENQGIADDQLKYLQLMDQDAQNADKKAYRDAMLRLAANRSNRGGMNDNMKLQFYKSDDASILKKNKEFVDQVKNYENLVENLGYQPFGKDRALLDNAFYNLGVSYKEAKELGAITGPDWEIIKGSIAPMTGLSGLVTKATGGGTQGVQSSLKQLKDLANQQSETRARSAEYIFGKDLVRGYQQNIGKGKKMVTNGNETLEIDEDDLNQAILDGFQEVK